MSLARRPQPTGPAPNVVGEALDNTPFDDEPYTDDEREAVRLGRQDVKDGKVVTTAELRRRLGL